jgi:hypothetical protein
MKCIVLICSIVLITSLGFTQENKNSFRLNRGLLERAPTISFYKPTALNIFQLKSTPLSQNSFNQEWLNTSIYNLTFWKPKQKFLGMELCEPVIFSWEIWGDYPYTNMRDLVEEMENKRFMSRNF